jgi:hypothetical protein
MDCVCAVGLNEVGTLHLSCQSQRVRQPCTAAAAIAAAHTAGDTDVVLSVTRNAHTSLQPQGAA